MALQIFREQATRTTRPPDWSPYTPRGSFPSLLRRSWLRGEKTGNRLGSRCDRGRNRSELPQASRSGLQIQASQTGACRTQPDPGTVGKESPSTSSDPAQLWSQTVEPILTRADPKHLPRTPRRYPPLLEDVNRSLWIWAHLSSGLFESSLQDIQATGRPSAPRRRNLLETVAPIRNLPRFHQLRATNLASARSGTSRHQRSAGASLLPPLRYFVPGFGETPHPCPDGWCLELSAHSFQAYRSGIESLLP